MSDQETKVVRQLAKLTRPRLQVLAEDLRIEGRSRLTKRELIDQILMQDSNKVRKLLHLTWWEKWRREVYGLAGQWRPALW